MQNRRILVIVLRELGDSLVSTPVLRQLNWLYPGVPVDVLCQPANRVIFASNPHVDQIFELRPKSGVRHFAQVANTLRAQGYDWVIDIQSLPKTALLSLLTGARRRHGYRRRLFRHWPFYSHSVVLTGYEYSARHRLQLLLDPRVDLDDVRIDFEVAASDRQMARQFRQRFFQRPVAAIYGVSRFADRLWSSESLATVADRLSDLGYQPFLVYGPGQYEAARTIARSMRSEPLLDYPIPSFAALKEILAGCALFVGTDGGPRHLAIAADVPAVVVQRGSDASIWAPPNRTDHRVVASRAHHNHPIPGRYVDVDAVAQIPLDVVWNEVETLLARTRTLPVSHAA